MSGNSRFLSKIYLFQERETHCKLDNKVRKMDILFIRHAESSNNVLLAELEAKMASGEYTRDQGLRKWYASRSLDAPLSEKGKLQASRLGEYYSEVLKDGDYLAFCSPFMRTLDTLHPLATALGPKKMKVIVHPEIYESGGVFESNPATKERVGSDKCFTGRQIKEKYGFDTSLIPQDKGWYAGKPFETEDMCIDRSKRVAEWLFTESLHRQAQGKTVVLVAHQHFLSFLFCALQGISPKSYAFPVGNTETIYATICRKPQRFVSFRWIGKSDHLSRHHPPVIGLRASL
ncbi:hypothetical protein DIPPA_15338 [Diplonema papillatum]|nr:hypothetical protein DIPPA_15338 [Diplonema papillatum]